MCGWVGGGVVGRGEVVITKGGGGQALDEWTWRWGGEGGLLQGGRGVVGAM